MNHDGFCEEVGAAGGLRLQDWVYFSESFREQVRLNHNCDICLQESAAPPVICCAASFEGPCAGGHRAGSQFLQQHRTGNGTCGQLRATPRAYCVT